MLSLSIYVLTDKLPHPSFPLTLAGGWTLGRMHNAGVGHSITFLTVFGLCDSVTLISDLLIIIIITHLLHENKSEVLTIEIEMVDMQMEQARSYKLIQGLVPRAG